MDFLKIEEFINLSIADVIYRWPQSGMARESAPHSGKLKIKAAATEINIVSAFAHNVAVAMWQRDGAVLQRYPCSKAHQ